MSRIVRAVVWLAMLAAIVLVVERGPGSNPERRLPYSEFLVMLDHGAVRKVVVESSKARGTLDDGSAFSTELPSRKGSRDQLIGRLREAVEQERLQTFDTVSPWLSEPFVNLYVYVLIPLGAMVLLWALIWRHAKRAGS
jgi:ATP-dependent Zn protease